MSSAAVVQGSVPTTRYSGGGNLMLGGLVAGGLGLVVTLAFYLGSAGNPGAARSVLASYLIAFTYWLGLAVTASIWIAIFHTFRAKWPIVLRRPLEVMSVTLPVFLVLFIPIFLGRGILFDWVNPPASFTPEQMELLHHKAPYLNVPFFAVRAIIYFAVWIGVSEAQFRMSLDQDETGNLRNLSRMRILGPASIPFLGLTITFAAFDWLMSLDPFWGSTIFGAYYWVGSFVAAFALLTVLAMRSAKAAQGGFGTLVTRDHMHNLGKLLFAFVAFWAYVAFSQFMLIWIANLPEEGEWYQVRMHGGWQSVGIALILGNFILPFFFLLGRATKFRRGTLTFAALWIMFFHLIDISWLVMPAIHQTHFELVSFVRTLIAFVGIGGLMLAFGVWRARGRFTVPIKDPFLADSMRYTQP